MRVVLYILLGLVVLLVAAVLVGPSFVDWNAQKDRIAREVEVLTDRQLKIDGDMELTVLPAPALLVDGVRFANLQGASTPYMIELEELQVKIKLLPLLQGRIEIESVFLVEPKIVLEVLPDGQKNWEFDTANGTEQAAADGDGFAGQVAVESFTITNGTLIYRDDRNGVREQLDRVDLNFVAESLTGPFSAAGRVHWRAIGLSLDAAIGRLVRDGAMPLKLRLGLPAAEAESQFSGTLSLHRDGVSLRGRLGAQGKSLAAAISAAAPNDPDAALPPPFARPFDIAANLSGDPGELTLEELRMKIGENTVTGQATVARGPPFNVNLALNATRVDLDRFLAPELDEGSAPTPPADGPALEEVRLPAGLSGRLEFTVEGLIYRGQAIRQVRLDAILDERTLTLGEGSAVLPGGSNLSLTGKLQGTEQGPRFDGRTELGTDNLRALLTWCGIDVAAVPADRLRRMSLKALVSATPDQASLSELDLRVDLSRITGAFVVALRERLALGIGVTLESLNLDAYLPPPPTGTDQPETRAALSALETFDANLDLRIGKLSLAGVTAEGLHVDATLDKGVLVLREASAASLAGGQASIAGVFSSFAKGPVFDGSLDVRVGDPLRLAKVIGLDTEAVARLGPLSLVANLQGSAERLGVNARLGALDGSLGFAGFLSPGAQPPQFDMEITLRHPELVALLAALDVPVEGWGQLGGIDLAGRAAGNPTGVQLSELVGYAGPLGLVGGFAVNSSASQSALNDLNMSLTLRHDNTGQLLAALGQPDLVSPELGPIALSARLTGSGQTPHLRDLAGQVGQTTVSGNLALDISGPRPVASATLTTGEVPVALLGAPAATDGEPEDDEPRWSPKPFDLGALRAFDGTLEMTSTALVDDPFRIEQVKLSAGLTNGVLTLDQLTGGLYEGTLNASGELDARGRTKVDLTVTVTDLEFGALLQASGGIDRVTGPITLNLSLASQGDSEAALVGALSGSGRLNGTITVKPTTEERFGGIALRFLGNRLKQVRDLTGLTTSIYDTFAGEAARLSGSYTIAKGVVSTNDTQLVNAKGEATLKGETSLPLWQQDNEVGIYSKKGLTRPLIKVDLTGPLDDPNVALSGLSSSRLNNLFGGPTNRPPEDSAPDGDAPVKIPGQEVIENVIDGLLPN